MKDTQIVKIAKALADPTRHQMLQVIRSRGELNCSQIHELFALSQPTISHHIKMLAAAGLVTCRKEGPYHVMTVDEAVLSGFAQNIAGPARAVGAEAATAAGSKPQRTPRSGGRSTRAKS